ncbi:MAG: tRNA (adenosine(37)-N6)-threonylcarbamoyltransferase complex transferase subunit TsaD, partial [Sphingomonadales bacterium]|nr:tRNA (adenosine(37)-N6)-threonylcarbamoyltransferase complex transferase subunit TsaD [Sphingomonadales bacterium]
MTKNNNIKVLGIETSCDDTAAAVVSVANGDGVVLSNAILSQFEEHKNYGGIVPEIAARAHANHLDDVIKRALSDAETDLADISAIAVTAGPGLIGGVMVGVVTAKAIALATGKPLYGINHLEGHALTTRLTHKTAFPYLLLLISGGHCQLIEVRGLGNYKRLGTTIDDAAGEAFDKTAKLLELGIPGGPAVEKLAMKGDKNRFTLPRPLKNKATCDFSFSGLKTALRREVELLLKENGTVSEQDKADLCAALQDAIADSLSA